MFFLILARYCSSKIINERDSEKLKHINSTRIINQNPLSLTVEHGSS